MAIQRLDNIAADNADLVRGNANHGAIHPVKAENLLMPISYKIVIRSPKPCELCVKCARDPSQSVEEYSVEN